MSKAFLYRIVFKYKKTAQWIFIFIAIFTTIFLYPSGIAKRLELLTRDVRFTIKPSRIEDSDIVLIDMDESDIQAIGRWPWPRKWHATLVSALSDFGARKIAFDVVFSESQEGIDDGAFSEAIQRAGNVYLPLLYNIKSSQDPNPFSDENIISTLKPIEPLRKWTKGTGHLNAVSDLDGILRRIPPVIDFNGYRTYQLGFKVGCDILGVEDKGIIFDPSKHVILLKRSGKDPIKIPLDRNNQLIVNWLGTWGKVFKHYSYFDVIKSYSLIKEGNPPLFETEALKDKICIVGLTASGLIDIKPVPIQSAYPAVGVNAMVISSVVNGDFVREAPVWVDIAVIVFMAIFATFILFKLRPLHGMFFIILCAIIYIMISWVLWNVRRLLIPTFYPLLTLGISYGLTASYVQLLQVIERRQLSLAATTDGLTSIYNIRHFKELLEVEFRNVLRKRYKHLSIIMFDVDNFKYVNDTYGHPAGDAILKKFAAIAQSHCRRSDVLGRYGGEEFIIMLSGAGSEKAARIAEKIRLACAEKTFYFEGKKHSTTISMGIAEFSGEKTKEELINKADKALYKSKTTGKNRVSL